MFLAVLLALALDDPGLVLELKLRERILAVDDPVVELALVNRSKDQVYRVVKPGDGSEVGWREPYVFWSADSRRPDGAWTALQPLPYIRCGNYNSFWEKDVVELKPGERLVLRSHLRKAQRMFDFPSKGRVRLVAHYRYRASRGDRGDHEMTGLAPLEDGPMKGVQPFELRSAAVELAIE